MIRILVVALLLAGCAITGAPDPRPGFTARNVGKTFVTHVEGLGTQAVYLAADGDLYIWSSAGPEVQRGSWRYDRIVAGPAATFRGAAGVNYPVEEMQTEWGICFRYRDAAGKILRRPRGGDWNCALLPAYEGLIAGRADGDIFGLTDGQPPARMPAERMLGIPALKALGG